MDSLVEAITELVIKELEQASSQGLAPRTAPTTEPPSSSGGPRLLVVPGPEPIQDEVWNALSLAKVRPTVLAWTGFRQDQLPGVGKGWPLESRGVHWTKIVADYRAVCLLGSDLPTLGSIAGLGAGGLPAAGAAIAGLSAGLPVFCEASTFERIRRHSSRLSPGLVRALEESWRAVASYGIEFGGAPDLTSFLERLGGGQPKPVTKTGGRDVVTTEDVDTAQRNGQKELLVGMGAIVTPLARQRAAELGIEVKFQ
jgi:hypothetical protein